MKSEYNHKIIEKKWIQRWERAKTYTTNLQKAKRPYYNLMMFPYPSAKGLHVGNMFSFTGSDIQGRFMRARGYDVFEPMGFDSFGMHAENFALKTGAHPARLTPMNVERFRENQLKKIGALFDWSHEIDTANPDYYRWTQWIFVQLFKCGLAYQKEATVNWCPSCKTVLADEQAEGGTCERCEAQVKQRDLRQWFFRITDYAQKLLDGLDRIDWSERTLKAQKNWIGRSEGVELNFSLVGSDDQLSVFTTRPDTLWGATYIVLAPEHPLIRRLPVTPDSDDMWEYLKGVEKTSIVERLDATNVKTGVPTGSFAVNPANNEHLPIWVSDFVLMAYGTGAIMAVPAHDVRDFDFAEKFDLPIIPVISPHGRDPDPTKPFVDDGVLINSDRFTDRPNREAAIEITKWLTDMGRGRETVNYRLHDWCISRQRYWGAPIPIIHCDACGPVAVPEEQLPVRLPFIEHYEPDGSGRSPLARDSSFVNTSCPECDAPARRETDVCDNFLDSAWYFFRFPSSDRSDVPFDRELTHKWLPADMYIGGNEHAVLHLMYTRFLTMVFKDIGLIDFEDPFKRYRANGTITRDGVKMSKSKDNMIDPDPYLEKYGSDVFRMYLMFLGPYLSGGDFRDTGILGIRRFIDRLYRYITTTEFTDGPVADRKLRSFLQQKIKKVTDDIKELRYNTAIAALMELLNGLTSQKKHYRECIRILLQMVCPFAPFVAHELWEKLGGTEMIDTIPWPSDEYDSAQDDMIPFMVQVDGKVRDKLIVSRNSSESELETKAMASNRVRSAINRRQVVRKVFVQSRLINLVTRDQI
jgi:leucyl-tRNA synthetase